MKTILLKVEVPDGYSILYPIIVCANHDMLIQGGAVTKEITMPSEEEIDDKIQDIGKGLGIEGIAGARLMIEWYKSQILKP